VNTTPTATRMRTVAEGALDATSLRQGPERTAAPVMQP
jgi:hypothetical protein